MSNFDDMNDIITAFSGNRSSIVIPKIFLEITGDYPTAAFLNQLIFWSDKSKRKDGYFYKKYDEWHDELLLSDYQIRRMTKKLEELNFIETALKKANGTPIKHYKVNMGEIRKAIIKKLHNGKSKNSIVDYEESQKSMDYEETSQSLTDDYTDDYNSETTTDVVGQSLALISNNFINLNTTIVQKIERSLEDIGKNAYEITEIAVNYTKKMNKSVNFLNSVLNNWASENVETVEQAKAKIEPKSKRAKKQNSNKKVWNELMNEGDKKHG